MKKSFILKIFFMTIIILSFSFLYIVFASPPISIDKLAQANLYDAVNDISYPSLYDNTEDNEGLFLANLVNESLDKNNLTTDIISNKTFDVEFIDVKGKSMVFSIYIDLERKLVQISEFNQNKRYKISQDNSDKLLLDSYFESIYKYRNPPEVKFEINGEIINTYEKSYNWAYKKSDSLWYQNKDLKDISLLEMEFILLKPSDVISLSYEIPPSQSVLKVYKDEDLIYESNIDSDSFNPLSYEGNFSYVISSTWNESDYKGSSEILFNCSMKMAPEFYISKSDVILGDAFFIKGKYIDADEKIVISQNINKTNPQFSKVGDEFISIFPINYWSAIGNKKISIWTEKKGILSSKKFIFNLNVNNRDFKKQFLTVDATVEASTRNDESYAQYNKYFPTSKINSTSKKLWDDEFIIPLSGRINTQYGEMRYVNNDLTSYRHSGIDIGGKKGADVIASNSGKVVLAMNLIVSGNTIVIDHGLNLFSAYKHLDSMDIISGDYVKKGQVIGKVGSTGFSTGPHLHFEISINNTSLNPEVIIGSDPLENLKSF